MAKASDYKVTDKFGATYEPWSPSKPHLGEDRSMPRGTPVDVGDTIIGKAGSTGNSSGPHVHVQKVHRGQVRDPQGAGLGNTIAFPAIVYETGYRNDIGKYARIRDAHDVFWSYFHHDVVYVKVGDIINAKKAVVTPAKAKDEMITSKDQAIKIYKMLRPNREPSKAELDHTVNKRTYAQFVNDAQKEIAERDEMFRAKDAKIRDLVNELQTAKTQAAELMQRPTIEAYQQLQDKLGSCQTKVIEASRPVDPIVIDTSEPETPKAPKLSLLAQIILWLDGRRKKA